MWDRFPLTESGEDTHPGQMALPRARQPLSQEVNVNFQTNTALLFFRRIDLAQLSNRIIKRNLTITTNNILFR